LLKEVSPSVLTWCTLLLATPIVAIYAINEGIPSINWLFFIGVIGSVIFYSAAAITRFRAMKATELSTIYPLVSLGPIFTMIFAFLPPLNEKPHSLAIFGVIIIFLGCYILNVSNAKEGLFKPIKLLFENKISALMILSVVLESIILIFDKLAIVNTMPGNSTFALMCENILIILGFLPILYLRKIDFTSQIFKNKWIFLLIGTLNSVSTILAFSAVSGGNVGIVSAIFKMQLLFVLLFSFIFFKDKPKLETVIGSVIMIAGVVLIKLGL
ncbi:MAG: Integral membrane protein DUF6, partial [uncultured bacterium]